MHDRKELPNDDVNRTIAVVPGYRFKRWGEDGTVAIYVCKFCKKEIVALDLHSDTCRIRNNQTYLRSTS